MVPLLILLSTNTLLGAPTETQINEIYKAVSGGKTYSINGTTATFSDGTNNWTILGAVQDKGDLYNSPSVWPVTEVLDIKIVEQPVSDVAILPYSEQIPNVSSITNSIKVQACRGEYEPASFVLRSGNTALNNVMVTSSDLTMENSSLKISNSNIDIRIVKCWFQAGVSLDRRDDNRKRLVPELLLYDNNLVKVDYDNQVNIVRNLSDKANFSDAKSLVPFEVVPRFNQQIWITFRIPESATPGRYSGNISVTLSAASKQYDRNIPVLIDVLDYTLVQPPIENALFYLGWYIEPSENYFSLGARGKSEKQILAEFIDMKNHGLTNIAIDHNYKLIDNKPDLTRLKPMLDLYRKAGFNSENLLYVDWAVSYYDNINRYEEKIKSIISLAKDYSFRKYYIYGKDEADYGILVAYKDAFRKVHELGGKNFLACNRDTAILMSDFIDVAILPRYTSLQNFNNPNSNMVVNGEMNIELDKEGAGWTSSNRGFLDVKIPVMKKKAGAYVYLGQKLPLVKGKNYRLEYTLSSVLNTNGFILAAGGGSCVNSDIKLSTNPGENSVVFTYNTESPYLRFAFGTSSEFELDNVVVREDSGLSTSNEVVPWAYNGPQAGKEVPGTYEEKFGVSLLNDGYKGVCNYAYQSGDCWDDWASEIWRPHVMSYPTSSMPIPTLQWEGWREGIDAMRHYISKNTKELQAPQKLRIE